jgi:hypothetical protein
MVAQVTSKCESWTAPTHQSDRAKPLQTRFRELMAELWPERHEFIAIDGKTARRTHDRGRA